MSPELNSRSIFTKSLGAASSLVAIGAKLRDGLPVTVTVENGSKETLFWFERSEIEVAGVKLPAERWLGLLLCPWPDFMACKEIGPNHLDHPIAFLKAAAENRQVLVRGVKVAEGKPFKVFRRGPRTVVIGADVPEENQRRLLERL